MKIKIEYTLDLGTSQLERLQDAYEIDKNGWGVGIYQQGYTFRQWVKAVAELNPRTFSDLNINCQPDVKQN